MHASMYIRLRPFMCGVNSSKGKPAAATTGVLALWTTKRQSSPAARNSSAIVTPREVLPHAAESSARKRCLRPLIAVPLRKDHRRQPFAGSEVRVGARREVDAAHIQPVRDRLVEEVSDRQTAKVGERPVKKRRERRRPGCDAPGVAQIGRWGL